jgi:hypothetical protein
MFCKIPVDKRAYFPDGSVQVNFDTGMLCPCIAEYKAAKKQGA